MNKTVLGIVLILAVVALGGFFYFTSQQTPPTVEETGTMSESVSTGDIVTDEIAPEEAAIEEAVVTYTDTGFSPRSVTVQQGQAVRFVNQSSRGMWVASNDHPTHTLYPIKSDNDCLGSSFDACAGIASGEAWTFTFTEAGSWSFHNHQQPSHRGTVVVR